MKIVIASNNKNKIKEFKNILEPMGYEVLSQSEAGINIEVPETGTCYKENAELKAETVYEFTKTAVLSDDSGLSIDCLDGAPGLYSARFKPELSQNEKNQFILDKMKNEKNRKAEFHCAICFLYENGEKIVVEGICEGTISDKVTMKDSFGYDPIFIPKGYDKTFAELKAEEKNKISHRAKAIEELRKKLRENN